jgi:hypothetical protein
MTETKTFTFDEYSKVVQDFQREQDKARRLEGEVVDVRKRLEPLEKVDLVALKAKAEELDLLKQQNAKTPDEIKQLIKEKETAIRAEIQRELDENKTALQKYQSENKELRVVDKAMGEIGKHFNDDMHPFVKQYVRQSVDVNDRGEYVIKDDSGDVRYSKVDRTKPMSLKEYADELAERHPSAARPTGTSGGMHAGTKSNGISGEMTPQKWLGMTVQQRAAYSITDQRKYGAEAVKAL